MIAEANTSDIIMNSERDRVKVQFTRNPNENSHDCQTGLTPKTDVLPPKRPSGNATVPRHKAMIILVLSVEFRMRQSEAASAPSMMKNEITKNSYWRSSRENKAKVQAISRTKQTSWPVVSLPLSNEKLVISSASNSGTTPRSRPAMCKNSANAQLKPAIFCQLMMLLLIVTTYDHLIS